MNINRHFIAVLLIYLINNQLQAQVSGQINLLKNPGFELGIAPFLNSCKQGIEDGIMTDWTCIPSYGYNKKTGKTEVYPYAMPCHAAVYDKNATDCYYYYDQNHSLILCGNAVCLGSRKIPYTGGGYRNTPSNSNRMVRIGCGTPVTTDCDLARRMGAVGKLDATLSANCIYTIKLKASLITENYCCLKGSPHHEKFPDWLTNNPYTKLVITLRKDNNPALFKEFHTGIHVNSSDWTSIEYPLSICAADAAVGYNQIEFRFEDIPTANFLINGISHSKYASMAFIDDVGVYTDQYKSPTLNLSNVNLSTASTWNNLVIAKINGTLTLNANLTIDGSFVYMTPGSKIVVKNGKTLSIRKNATLESQCDLWEGIVVEDGGNVQIFNSTINDAITAVKINGLNTRFNLEGNTFRRCINGLELSNTDMNSKACTVYGNTFDGGQMLKNNCLTNANARKGILVKNQAAYNYVNIGRSTDMNQFISLSIGTYVEGSDVFITHNRYVSCQSGIAVRYCVRGERIEINGGNQFIENNLGIAALTGNPSLSIYQNNLFRSNQVGIQASACQGIRLSIGGQTSTEGNFFTANTVAVKLANNAYNSMPNGVASEFGVTDYYIANNGFANKTNGTGILILESSKSSASGFNKIHILQNTFNALGTAVKCTNLTGNKGEYEPKYSSQLYLYDDKTITNYTRVFNNQITYNSAQNPLSLGIYNENSRAIQITKNTLKNPSVYDWRNTGAHLQDCDMTLVQDNIFSGNGLGLHVVNNMSKSNYLCNQFTKNINGIDINAQVLRDKGEVHGYIGTPKNLSRDNFHSQRATYGADLMLANSNPVFNQWLFQFKPPAITIKNNLGQIDNRIVDIRTSTLDCEANKTTSEKGGSGGTHDLNFDWPSLSGYDLFVAQYLSESDWFGSSAAGSINSRIAGLVLCQNFILAGEADSAGEVLKNISPENDFEAKYKTVLGLVLQSRPSLSELKDLDSLSLDTLRQIAQLDARIGGLAVYLARAAVQIQTGEDIRDPENFDNTLSGHLFIEGECTDSLSYLPLMLVDQDGWPLEGSQTYTDDKARFAFYPGYLQSLEPGTLVAFRIPEESGYSIHRSDYKTIEEWRSLAKLSIACIKIDVEAQPFDQPYQKTLWVKNENGVQYEAAQVLRNGQTDLVITQTGASGWRRYYAGPDNASDSVFAICRDAQNNVYLSGSTTAKGKRLCLTLKYTADGLLDWVRLFSDSLNPLKGTGIEVIGNEVYVRCEGAEAPLDLHYSTCGTGSENLAMSNAMLEPNTGVTELQTSEQLFKVYPNPGKGQLNVSLSAEENAEIEIYNSNGQKVFKQKISQGVNVLTTALPPGLYFYLISTHAQPLGHGQLLINE